PAEEPGELPGCYAGMEPAVGQYGPGHPPGGIGVDRLGERRVHFAGPPGRSGDGSSGGGGGPHPPVGSIGSFDPAGGGGGPPGPVGAGQPPLGAGHCPPGAGQPAPGPPPGPGGTQGPGGIQGPEPAPGARGGRSAPGIPTPWASSSRSNPSLRTRRSK